MCKFASAGSVEDGAKIWGTPCGKFQELFKYFENNKEDGDDVWNSCHSLELTYG